MVIAANVILMKNATITNLVFFDFDNTKQISCFHLGTSSDNLYPSPS